MSLMIYQYYNGQWLIIKNPELFQLNVKDYDI